jgi:hypothetical protein
MAVFHFHPLTLAPELQGVYSASAFFGLPDFARFKHRASYYKQMIVSSIRCGSIYKNNSDSTGESFEKAQAGSVCPLVTDTLLVEAVFR